MKLFRTVRLLLLAMLVSIVPASSFAGVFISVGFAPPILPVYEQPPCPEEGLMWMPGYWAYGDEGYFWVPGTWVPAPYEGALWTPPYWGWSEGIYVFHPGYWGDHVGYYGGVNYGYGYMGVGFAGGMWRGHDFVYNRAVMRVDDRYVRNTYEDRTIVERNTIINDNHVAFSGGPGGIRHEPMPEERMAERENHLGATSFQASHESSAMTDRGSYATRNGGHPQNLAVQRPFNQGGQGMQAGPPNPRGGYQSEPGGHPGAQGGYQAEPGAKAGSVGGYQGEYPNRGNQGGNPAGNQHPTYQNNPGTQNNGNQTNPYQGRGNPNGNYNQPPAYNAPNNGNNQPREYNQQQPNNPPRNYNPPPQNNNQETKTYNASHSNTGNAPAQPPPPQPQQHVQQQPPPQRNAPPPQNGNQGKGKDDHKHNN
jgi:hypothetical protein